MNASEKIISDLLKKKFGEETYTKIAELVARLIIHDQLIIDKKSSYLEKMLSVQKKDISKTLDFLFELSRTNSFAAAFFIEKIPLLYFHDLFYDYITLLSLTRHYSSRSLAYTLGSSDLISNDFVLNVKTIKIELYKKIINIVIRKHENLNILSLHIIRYLWKIIPVIGNKNIVKFINICTTIRKLYGNNTAIAYLDNIQVFHQYVSLENVLFVFNRLSKISNEYLLFAINYPEIINNKKYLKKTQTDAKKLKINILEKNDFVQINYSPTLLQDKYFLALLMSWKKYPSFHKENILQQLQTPNFKKTILKDKKIIKEVNEINQITNNNWFLPWGYANQQIDNLFIYEELRKILLPSKFFKHNTKKIYNEQKNIIENIKIEPKTKLLEQFIEYLLKICTNKDVHSYLEELKKYLKDPSDMFLNKYSKNNLFVKTWDRDPWVDYARSDELYACTSIGEATDFYATLYLADIITNNLDIYNNSLRIGRIHLFLVKDVSNELVLLVDCIDGSDRLMRNETRLTYLLDSIKTYARHIKIKKIFFNTDLMFNNTPKLFVKFLKSKYENEEDIYIERYIKGGSQKQLMPFPLISFTESLKDKNEGLIKGFLINITQ